jgi:hypothetical protein
VKTWHILAAVAAVGVAWLVLRPARVASGSGGDVDVLARLAGLPDPSTLPLGTTRSVGGSNYIVTQSRQPGAVPQWTFGGYGGGVPQPSANASATIHQSQAHVWSCMVPLCVELHL